MEGRGGAGEPGLAGSRGPSGCWAPKHGAPAESRVAENKRVSRFGFENHHPHKNIRLEPSPSQEALDFFTVLQKKMVSILYQYVYTY